MQTSKPNSQLALVQMLRALAATLVLIGHAKSQVIRTAAAAGTQLTPFPWPGGFGVDLFFVISGFIMVVSSSQLFEKSRARIVFLLRRASRLIPMYWLATIIFLPTLIFGNHPYAGNIAAAIATSLAFIPYPTYGIDNSAVFPIYTLGWSLNYEVFFYLIFSCFLSTKRARAVYLVIGMLLVFVAAGYLLQPQAICLQFWSQPIILEFGLGVLIANIWLGDTVLRRSVCLALGVLGIALLLADPLGEFAGNEVGTTANDFHRFFGWGIPAAAILMAAVFFEKDRPMKFKALGWVVFFGDCSYALYLVHPFSFLVVSKLWSHIGLNSIVGWGLMGFVLVVTSVILACVTHVFVERPLTRRLHRYIPRAAVKQSSTATA